MKKTLLAGMLVCIIFNAIAQQKQEQGYLDSVTLQEVTVTGILPVNNQSIINFYRSNNFSSIDDMMARVEGVSLIKRGAYAMEPQLGGFSAGQLNITIDGMKIFGACTDKMDPVTSYIEPSNLKSIRINHGTNSGETGANIGGSVDLSLQEPHSGSGKAFSLSTALGYESVFRGKNLQFASGYMHNKWSYGMNGVYRKYENYVNGAGETVPFSQFEKVNIHASIKFQADSSGSFKTDVLLDLARNAGYAALPMDVSKAQAVLIALEYNRMRKASLKVKAYFNVINHVMDDSKRDSIFYLKNKANQITDTVLMRMDMPGRSSTYGAYAQYELSLNNKNRLLVKIDNYTNYSIAEMTMYMHYIGRAQEKPMYMQTWPGMLRNVSGIFLQHTVRFRDNLSVSVSGRLDYAVDFQQNDLTRKQFSVLGYSLPRNFSNVPKSLNGSVKYNLTKHLIANVSLGMAERLPTNTERYGFYLFNTYDGYDYIGNPYIKTEKSVFFELKL